MSNEASTLDKIWVVILEVDSKIVGRSKAFHAVENLPDSESTLEEYLLDLQTDLRLSLELE